MAKIDDTPEERARLAERLLRERDDALKKFREHMDKAEEWRSLAVGLQEKLDQHQRAFISHHRRVEK